MNSIIYPVMRTAIDAGVLYTFLLAGAIINKTRSTDPFVLTSIVRQSFLHPVSPLTYSPLTQIVPCISIIFYMVIMRIAVAQASNRLSMSRPVFFQSQHNSRLSRAKQHPQLTTVEIFVSESKTSDAREQESISDRRSSIV